MAPSSSVSVATSTLRVLWRKRCRYLSRISLRGMPEGSEVSWVGVVCEGQRSPGVCGLLGHLG